MRKNAENTWKMQKNSGKVQKNRRKMWKNAENTQKIAGSQNFPVDTGYCGRQFTDADVYVVDTDYLPTSRRLSKRGHYNDGSEAIDPLNESASLAPALDKMDSCCKLGRLPPQDGLVGSLKDTLARQCVTSDAPVAMLDFCSNDAHNTRAIPLTLSWDDAVRQENKFMRREIKQTKHLSETTGAGASKQRTPNRKTRKINKNGRSAKYIHAGKSPGEMSRQTNRSIQTHYFKFKFQEQTNVSQYTIWL